ncbi:MAG: hypothetical protein RR460_08695 [Clostridium sp.]
MDNKITVEQQQYIDNIVDKENIISVTISDPGIVNILKNHKHKTFIAQDKTKIIPKWNAVIELIQIDGKLIARGVARV